MHSKPRPIFVSHKGIEMIDTKSLGAPPVGLVEKSRERVEHTVYFGSTHYDEYQMLDGVSHYCGSVDYREVTLQ